MGSFQQRKRSKSTVRKPVSTGGRAIRQSCLTFRALPKGEVAELSKLFSAGGQGSVAEFDAKGFNYFDKKFKDAFGYSVTLLDREPEECGLTTKAELPFSLYSGCGTESVALHYNFDTLLPVKDKSLEADSDEDLQELARLQQCAVDGETVLMQASSWPNQSTISKWNKRILICQSESTNPSLSKSGTPKLCIGSRKVYTVGRQRSRAFRKASRLVRQGEIPLRRNRLSEWSLLSKACRGRRLKFVGPLKEYFGSGNKRPKLPRRVTALQPYALRPLRNRFRYQYPQDIQRNHENWVVKCKQRARKLGKFSTERSYKNKLSAFNQRQRSNDRYSRNRTQAPGSKFALRSKQTQLNTANGGAYTKTVNKAGKLNLLLLP